MSAARRNAVQSRADAPEGVLPVRPRRSKNGNSATAPFENALLQFSDPPAGDFSPRHRTSLKSDATILSSADQSYACVALAQ